jgi:uncharacterized protein YbjT (DUF2867 family)
MDVLVTGATGYIGTRLVATLAARRHAVRALARPGSEGRVPAGVPVVPGDALDPDSVAGALRSGDTLVHLVGTPHPDPSKAAWFERVDLGSIRASVAAARRVALRQIVYVSVAHPAPVMQAYIAARVEGESAIRVAGLTATILRPWYVLGPGHWWPLVLAPVYTILEWLPGTRQSARRLGLVTLAQMIAALVSAVEAPPPSGQQRIVEVPAIRAARLD